MIGYRDMNNYRGRNTVPNARPQARARGGRTYQNERPGGKGWEDTLRGTRLSPSIPRVAPRHRDNSTAAPHEIILYLPLPGGALTGSRDFSQVRHVHLGEETALLITYDEGANGHGEEPDLFDKVHWAT